jgi:hypothetical protein
VGRIISYKDVEMFGKEGTFHEHKEHEPKGRDV